MNPATVAASSDSVSKATTKTTCLFIFLISFYIIQLISSDYHKPYPSSSSDYDDYCYYYPSSSTIFSTIAAAFVIIAVVVIIFAVRTTVVTWITVLVLLAFAGNRRRSLVKNGRKITSEVAMHLVRIVVTKERGVAVLAFAAATVGSLIMAMVWFRKFL